MYSPWAIPNDPRIALANMDAVFPQKAKETEPLISCPDCGSKNITSCPGGTCLKPDEWAKKYICMDCLAEFGDGPLPVPPDDVNNTTIDVSKGVPKGSDCIKIGDETMPRKPPYWDKIKKEE